jgi:hypothetical protein
MPMMSAEGSLSLVGEESSEGVLSCKICSNPKTENKEVSEFSGFQSLKKTPKK